MSYQRIIAALHSAKWAALPSTIQAIHKTLAAHVRGELKAGQAAQPPNVAQGKKGDFTVIPVQGIIGKNLSQLEMECGGCDVNTVRQAITDAIADENCMAIMLAFDSPGGVVTGVPELAGFIRAAGAEKPIYAFTDGQCCSAAYWLASATQGIFCTQTADVGSIGVYVALVDETEAWAQAGYKLELMKAGTFKGMGMPGQPLADNERVLIQSDVDKIYGMFTADILKNRPAVGSAAMQGQTFMGKDAVSAGLVDELVGGIDELLSELVAETY